MTLMELMVVVVLVALIAGISFPAVTSGIDTLRLRSASESVVGLFNTALDRADRRQQPMEIVIDKANNTLHLLGMGPGVEHIVELPQGVRILAIAPPQFNEGAIRSFVLLPSGAVPRFSVLLANVRGSLRSISVDPITGVARIETLPQQAVYPQ